MTEPAKAHLTFRHAAQLALAATSVATPIVVGLLWWPDKPWKRGAFALLSVFCLSLGIILARLVTADRQLLWATERRFALDFDGDGVVGKPEPREMRVEVVSEGGRHRRYARIPLSDAELLRLAKAVVWRKVPWSRRKLDEARALSQEKYGTVKDAMLRAGFLRLVGETENAGLEVTASGRAFFRQVLGGD